MTTHPPALCYHPISMCLRSSIGRTAIKYAVAMTAAVISEHIPIKPLAGVCFGGATFAAWGSLRSFGLSAVQVAIGSAISAGGWAIAHAYKDLNPAFRLVGYAGWGLGLAAAHLYSRYRRVEPLQIEQIQLGPRGPDSAIELVVH